MSDIHAYASVIVIGCRHCMMHTKLKLNNYVNVLMEGINEFLNYSLFYKNLNIAMFDKLFFFIIKENYLFISFYYDFFYISLQCVIVLLWN